MKNLVAALLALVLIYSSTSYIFASSTSYSMKLEATSEASQSAKQMQEEKEAGPVDSFTLFWPLTAGKTKDEGFYWLKRLKENLRGLLIFGSAQKADYSVFLSEKRLLEAEKLINQNKYDMANQTLDDAISDIKAGKDLFDKSKSDGSSEVVKENITHMLGNMHIFIPTLVKVNSSTEPKLNELDNQVKSFQLEVK